MRSCKDIWGVYVANVDEDLSYHSDQVRLREFIEAVKQDKITDDVKDDFSEYIDSIDCSPVILGCTELPLLVQIQRLTVYWIRCRLQSTT